MDLSNAIEMTTPLDAQLFSERAVLYRLMVTTTFPPPCVSGFNHFVSSQKQYPEAVRDYSQAIELEPDNASFYSCRGTFDCGLFDVFML